MVGATGIEPVTPPVRREKNTIEFLGFLAICGVFHGFSSGDTRDVNKQRENGPALEVAARSPVKFIMENKLSNDPSVITCQLTKTESTSRLSRPYLTCAYNSYWVARAYGGPNPYTPYNDNPFDLQPKSDLAPPLQN
jgi:hypothetical protein